MSTITVPTGFQDAVQASHKVITKLEVYLNGLLQQSLSDVVLEGSVSEDKNNAIRRRAKFTISDPTGELTPIDMNDLLAPKGTELRPYRGIRMPDGSEFLVSLGFFAHTDVDTDDNGEEYKLYFEGYDRSQKVRRARFTDTYVVASGTVAATAIKTIIENRVTSLDWSLWPSYTETTGRLTFDRASDPWEACEKIARSHGWEVFFDNDGRPRLRPEPAASSSGTSWNFEEGTTVLYISQKFRAPDYNHVFEIGEGAHLAAPVVGEAKDDDPSSPTYYLGAFGDSPTFHVSDFYTSQAQTQAAADAKLRRILGSSIDVQFMTIPNPALMVGDQAYISRGRMGLDMIALLDRVTTPLRATQSQNAKLRTRVIQ